MPKTLKLSNDLLNRRKFLWSLKVEEDFLTSLINGAENLLHAVCVMEGYDQVLCIELL